LLSCLLLECSEVSVWIVAEAGASGAGLPPSIERAAQLAPARMVDLAEVACGSELSPRADAGDRPH
jgi:hypothetical protein